VMRRQWMQARLQPAVVSQKIRRGGGWAATVCMFVFFSIRSLPLDGSRLDDIRSKSRAKSDVNPSNPFDLIL